MDILTSDIKAFVKSQRLGYVATVCDDGTPNLSPKGTLTVWDDDHLVFADICSPATVKHIRRRPGVEVNVVDPFSRRGYRFKGEATILESGTLFDAIADLYRRNGVSSPFERVVLITVKRVRELRSPSYDAGATEEELRKQWKEFYLGTESQQK